MSFAGQTDEGRLCCSHLHDFVRWRPPRWWRLRSLDLCSYPQQTAEEERHENTLNDGGIFDSWVMISPRVMALYDPISASDIKGVQ